MVGRGRAFSRLWRGRHGGDIGLALVACIASQMCPATAHFGEQYNRQLHPDELQKISAQKPRYRAWQQDPVLVRTWETETFPAIAKQAKREGASVYFADESGIRSDDHTGTTWAPKGQTPTVVASGRRFSLNMLSAINPRGELRFMLHEGTVTAGVFLECLKRLLVGAKGPMFLIADGHPSHRAKRVKTFVDST